jgi:hypothetical protein
MVVELGMFAIALLVGVGIGAWLNKVATQWEAENKEPSPELVRNRKELVTALFVVSCIAILITGIATKDSHGGLALIAICIVPLLFLFFELIEARHEDNSRGLNALGYFILNVVLYGCIRMLNWLPGVFENLNALYATAFFQVTLGSFITDVVVTGVSAFVTSDNSGAEGFQRAVPIYLKTYAVMLAILGLLLIISN